MKNILSRISLGTLVFNSRSLLCTNRSYSVRMQTQPQKLHSTDLLPLGVLGDEVGIYSPTARPTSGEADGVTNRRFSAVTAGYSSAFTAISGNEMYWGTANPHMFYAYYPYSAAAFVDLPDLSLRFDERLCSPLYLFRPKVKFYYSLKTKYNPRQIITHT